MALIDNASLLMVPSVYEDGTLYNVLPSGNKAPDETGNHNGYDQTRADFTFSRGSNLAATRVNSSGLIEKGRENLLLQSNQFDTTWSTTNASVTGGQSGYDGTSDAWLLNESAAGGRVFQTIAGSGVMTMSLYAKSGTLDFILVYVNTTGTDPYAYFDLTNGDISTSGVGSRITATAVDAGNGWYRLSVTGNVGTLSAIEIYPANSLSSHSTSAGSVYIQDAQLEKSLVSTAVMTSGASTAKAGILEDMPRINYDANGENGALLLEPSRSNKITQAFYFGDSSWTKSGMTLTTNTSDTKSPEGVYNAAHVEATNTDPYLLAYPSVTTGDVTFSIYVKAVGDAVGRACSIHLDYDFGTGSGTNATKTFNALSDWTRFDVTGNCSTAGTVRVRVELGNVATVGDDFYIFGAQCENGSYPSSLIPTHGAAVTRSADSWYADNIGQTTAYTIFIDYQNLEQADSSFQDYISFQANGGTQDGLRAEGVGSEWRLYGYNISGSVTFPIAGSVSKKKKAIVVSTAGIKLFEDGALTNEDLSGMTVPTLGAIVSKRGTSAPYPAEIKQSYKQIAVFNEALSDAECISLTS